MRSRVAIASAMLFSLYNGIASAEDVRCKAPPYGGDVRHFKAFAKVYGPLLSDPSKVLASVCNMKFGGRNRRPLYNLGFTDAEIDSEETSTLAAKMFDAVGNVLDHRR